MTPIKHKTILRNSPHGHVIALYMDGKTTYHYVEDASDEDKLIGEIVGRYTAGEYLKDEKRIQEFHKIQMNLKEEKNEKV